MIVCDHCLGVGLLTVIGDCEPYVSREDINWDDISTIFHSATISIRMIFQQYFNVIQYPPRQYLNNISLSKDIQPHYISIVLHRATISTRTIFQQYYTMKYNSIRCDDISTMFHSATKSTRTIFQKASAPATNQEQQSTDLAFGKIQVPRRNWFSCTYVHTQISMHCNGQVEAFRNIFIPWPLPA